MEEVWETVLKEWLQLGFSELVQLIIPFVW